MEEGGGGEVGLQEGVEVGGGEALEHGDAAVPFGVVPGGHAAIHMLGEGEVAALGGQPLGGVAGFVGSGG